MQGQQGSVRVEKCFTVDEANAMLPLVRSIVSVIRDVFNTVTQRRSDLHRLLRRRSRTDSSLYDAEMAESRADLRAEYEQIWKYREELESLGVILRTPESGSVEFPTEIGGEFVYLCWQIGDESIAYWRPDNSAFAARQPLP